MGVQSGQRIHTWKQLGVVTAPVPVNASQADTESVTMPRPETKIFFLGCEEGESEGDRSDNASNDRDRV